MFLWLFCGICGGRGILPASEYLDRPPACTCGAGPADDEMTRHAPGCDTVECPFCLLLHESFWRVAERALEDMA